VTIDVLLKLDSGTFALLLRFLSALEQIGIAFGAGIASKRRNSLRVQPRSSGVFLSQPSPGFTRCLVLFESVRRLHLGEIRAGF